MMDFILITVQSVVLFVSGALSEPTPFCTVQFSGCSALGASLKRDVERLYPSTPVVLIVDGKSNQSL